MISFKEMQNDPYVRKTNLYGVIYFEKDGRKHRMNYCINDLNSKPLFWYDNMETLFSPKNVIALKKRIKYVLENYKIHKHQQNTNIGK